MKCARCWLSLVSLWALSACDGIGRQVVDRYRTGAGSPSCETRGPVACDDVIGAPTELDVGVPGASELPECELGALLSGSRIHGTLHGCRLEVDATLAAQLEIVDATLDNVRIQLDRRVDLRILESRLFRVAIEAVGGPADGEPAPVWQISHSQLSWSHVQGELIELLSSHLESVLLEGEHLSAVDVKAEDSRILAREATISAGNLSATHLGGCQTMLIAGTRAINSRFAACEDVTRIYDVEATGSTLDGQIVADMGTFSDCRLGVEAPTQLHGWYTGINNSVLCENFAHLRFSGGNVTCSRCLGAMSRSEGDVCYDPARVPAVEGNTNCDALDLAPVCESFPEDARPIDF